MKNETLEEYTSLIKAFLSNTINVQEFECRYLERFKNETTVFPPNIFEVLDTLFAAVDAFCPDPKLCDKDDLNEQQLRAMATEALAELARK